VDEYLKQGGVQVEETLLSDDIKPSFEIDDFIEEMAKKYGRDAIYSTDGNYSYVKNTFPWMLSKEDQERYEEVRLRTQAERDAQRALRPKYDQYTLPGGKNYREVLLTLPAKRKTYDRRGWVRAAEQGLISVDEFDRGLEGGDLSRPVADYRSKHWDQPNVIAHIRLNDRTDADGKRVLFIEELQSDWGQEGKKKGFAQDTTGWRVRQREDSEDPSQVEIIDRAGQVVWQGTSNGTDSQTIARAVKEVKESTVPAAPFVTKTEGWLNLALKRVMVMAAEGGYDRVAFVNGEQSADRYDLSKQISKIRYEDNRSGGVGMASMDGPPTDGQFYAYDLDGDVKIDKRLNDPVKELPDLIGKELAERLLNAPPVESRGIGSW